VSDTIEDIVATLRGIADAVELSGGQEPYPKLELEQHLGRAVLRLKMDGSPNGIRARADRLLKQAKSRTISGTPGAEAMRSASKWRPSMGVAKRSARVERQFLDDGERENYDEYRALFA
jgi:hypothetical protein